MLQKVFTGLQNVFRQLYKAQWALWNCRKTFAEKLLIFAGQRGQRPVQAVDIQNVGRPQVGSIYCKLVIRVPIGTPKHSSPIKTGPWGRCTSLLELDTLRLVTFRVSFPEGFPTSSRKLWMRSTHWAHFQRAQIESRWIKFSHAQDYSISCAHVQIMLNLATWKVLPVLILPLTSIRLMGSMMGRSSTRYGY